MYLLSLIVAEWCTILCLEDNKTYNCRAKDLETDSQEFVTLRDLAKGNELVWQYRGRRYMVEVLSVHGECV